MWRQKKSWRVERRVGRTRLIYMRWWTQKLQLYRTALIEFSSHFSFFFSEQRKRKCKFKKKITGKVLDGHAFTVDFPYDQANVNELL
jgi:hypothetical protein